MTRHELKLHFDAEVEPYARWKLECSDNGGATCANPVEVRDCDELRVLKEAYEHDLTEDERQDYDHWLSYAQDQSIDCGWWWEGQHCHWGPVGSGCAHVEWFSYDPGVFDLRKPIDFTIPVDVEYYNGECDPVALSPRLVMMDVPQTEYAWKHPDDCKHLDLVVERNNGHRWVTCTICHSEFSRVER